MLLKSRYVPVSVSTLLGLLLMLAFACNDAHMSRAPSAPARSLEPSDPATSAEDSQHESASDDASTAASPAEVDGSLTNDATFVDPLNPETYALIPLDWPAAESRDVCAAVDGTVLDAAWACDDQRPCDAGEICVPGGCNGKGRCLHTGARCGSTAECADDVPCIDGFCRPQSMLRCSDSRSCPSGFRCETTPGGMRSCVDRRLPCALRDECPAGHICRETTLAAPSICVPFILVCSVASDAPCFSDERCFPLASGSDVGACGPAHGACESHADCSGETPRCDADPFLGEAVCARAGACLEDGDCAPGDRCVDVRKNDLGICHPPQGCQSDAQCPPNARCGLAFPDAASATCLCRSNTSETLEPCVAE